MTPRTGLKLRAEYGCWPLWDSQGENVDPASLPISAALLEDLSGWMLRYEATLCEDHPPDSGFVTEQERSGWDAMGERLAGRLTSELAGTVVEYETDSAVRAR